MQTDSAYPCQCSEARQERRTSVPRQRASCFLHTFFNMDGIGWHRMARMELKKGSKSRTAVSQVRKKFNECGRTGKRRIALLAFLRSPGLSDRRRSLSSDCRFGESWRRSSRHSLITKYKSMKCNTSASLNTHREEPRNRNVQ